MKYKTLNFAILHLSADILCHSPQTTQKQKMAAKTTSVLYFCNTLLHDFWFLHDLELIKSCFMLFVQNDLYLTYKSKMFTANTQIKAIFVHVNYDSIKKQLFNG